MSDSLLRLLRFLNTSEVPQTLVLACDHSDLPQVSRRVCAVHNDSCLGRWPVGSLAQVLALGVEHLAFVPCDRDAGLPELIALAQRIFPGRCSWWEAPDSRWRHGKWLELSQLGVSRRSFLGLASRCELDLEASWQVRTAQAFAALNVLKSVDTALISASGGAGSKTAEPADEPHAKATPLIPEERHLPLSWRLKATDCNTCGVCVVSCPHRALSLRPTADGSNVFTLSQVFVSCEGDGTCVRLCPLQALQATGHPTWGEVSEGQRRHLIQVETRVCASCHNRYPVSAPTRDETASIRNEDAPASSGSPATPGRPGPAETLPSENICPTCAFRQAHPFGAIPPYAIAQFAIKNRPTR